MILFVFEGKKDEPEIMDTIKELYFEDDKYVFVSYCSDIQSLFNNMNKDRDLDLVGLLKENEKKHPELKKKLEDYKSDEFSEIYLFFDYDIKKIDGYNKDSLETQNEKIKVMLDFFNNETVNGKLYINYPMVESIRYFKRELPDEDYYTYTTNLFIGKNFKDETNNFTYYKNKKLDFIIYKYKKENIMNLNVRKANWEHIIKLNIKKANYICAGLNKLPSEKTSINQQAIFENQLSKYVYSKNEISILNSFPLFLYEYFPIDYFN